MNEMKPISNFKNNLYQVAIILLLAYAAFSTAMKDLDRLQEVAGSVRAASYNGLGGLAKVYSATKSLADEAELAWAPQGELTAPPRVDIVAAGGSVELSGFNDAVASAKVSCPVRKRTVTEPVVKDLNWNVVAQVPRRVRFLRDEKISVEKEAEIAALIQSAPRLRAFINKLPKSGRTQWSNVNEFKSLNDVSGFEFKVAHRKDAEREAAEIEPSVQPSVETTDAPSRYVLEIKRGVSDDDSDNLETHQ